MLAKALKHDIKAIWRFWWIIAVSVVGLSAVSSVVIRFIIENQGNSQDNIFRIIIAVLTLFAFISIAAIVMSPAATNIIVYLRYYKNFFTDEGYLTFTLPVSRAKLFMAKTINAMIWNTLHFAVLAVCAFIIILFGIPSESGGFINIDIFKDIGDILSALLADVPFRAYLYIALYAIEYIVILVASVFMSVNLVQMCITIGAIVAKKAKILVAIGIFYLVNVGFSTVGSIILNLMLITSAGGFVELVSNSTEFVEVMIIAVILLMVALAMAALGLLFYLITLDKIERRLNLA